MMSAHVDTFIAVEAAEGKVQDVENALKAYKETLAGGFQYPSNMSKVNAAQILTIDNKVFFVLLGAYPENQEMTEEDLAAYYADEVQKVVDVINTTLGK